MLVRRGAAWGSHSIFDSRSWLHKRRLLLPYRSRSLTAVFKYPLTPVTFLFVFPSAFSSRFAESSNPFIVCSIGWALSRTASWFISKSWCFWSQASGFRVLMVRLAADLCSRSRWGWCSWVRGWVLDALRHRTHNWESAVIRANHGWGGSASSIPHRIVGPSECLPKVHIAWWIIVFDHPCKGKLYKLYQLLLQTKSIHSEVGIEFQFYSFIICNKWTNFRTPSESFT